MNALLNPQIFVLVYVGLGGAFMGLLGLLSSSSQRGRARLGLGLLTMAVVASLVWGGWALAADYPLALSVSPLALGSLFFALFLLPALARTNATRFLVHLLSQRRFRTLGLLGMLPLFPLVALAVVGAIEDPSLIPVNDPNAESRTFKQDEPVLEAVAHGTVTTDAGRSLMVWHDVSPHAGHIDPTLLSHQLKVLTVKGLRDRVIYVPDSWQNSNCHGWTFAGGQFWIKGEDVPIILQDNGYQPVSLPRAGDIAVYRDPETDAVTHTGVVRWLGSGMIVVESKWGKVGRFLHPHDVHCYGDSVCTFYRSERVGHHLLGLQPGSLPSPPDVALLPDPAGKF